MAPKKKGNKKGNDDWEADLGENVDPIAAATQEAKEINAAQDARDEDIAGGGGLLAALKKNKSKKQKKGKAVQEDYLEGEDPPTADGATVNEEANGVGEAPIKAPEEANADDLFDAQPTAKQKSGKDKPGKLEPAAKEDEEESGEEVGGLKSKKEKEREKKEREKQRKKEQVCPPLRYICRPNADYAGLELRMHNRLLRRKPLSRPQRQKPRLRNPLQKLNLSQRQQHLLNRPKARRKSQAHLLRYRSSKKR